MPRAPVVTAARSGGAAVTRIAPNWPRRYGLPADAYFPPDSSIKPQQATLPPPPAANLPPEPAPRTAPAHAIVSVQTRTKSGPDGVALEEYRALLKHAQFLIKAGLGPMAKEPLEQILRGAPGTPIAREARLTLNTIRN
ncbi:MAG TPA: hypothetical protein VEI07_09740 [Planctomycetaceae bacterium]|nr:hypothetical protein [Planctomycetaceae bacterium]